MLPLGSQSSSSSSVLGCIQQETELSSVKYTPVKKKKHRWFQRVEDRGSTSPEHTSPQSGGQAHLLLFLSFNPVVPPTTGAPISRSQVPVVIKMCLLLGSSYCPIRLNGILLRSLTRPRRGHKSESGSLLREDYSRKTLTVTKVTKTICRERSTYPSCLKHTVSSVSSPLKFSQAAS